MGKYFVMSTRFNKQTALDFGLLPIDENTAINASDNTLWIKANLYDFGWGKENGYYKHPLLDFDDLLNLALSSDVADDVYGAVAIILDKHPDELLNYCEAIMDDCTKIRMFKKIVSLFTLECPINRTATINKSHSQIQMDFERWQQVSEKAKRIKKGITGWFV